MNDMREVKREVNGYTKGYNRRFRQVCDAIASKHESAGLNNFSRLFDEKGMPVATMRMGIIIEEVEALSLCESQVENEALAKVIEDKLLDIAHYAIATVCERRERKNPNEM